MYQQVIANFLPGYEILKNEDMSIDDLALRPFLSPEIITARKKRTSLGLIVGRFNEDKYPDFAALVVNRSLKKFEPGNKEKYEARLLVCLGASTPEKYECEILPTWDGNQISLPLLEDFEVFKVEKDMQCTTVQMVPVYYPEGWHGVRKNELPSRKININYDGIMESTIGANAVRLLIRGRDGSYLDCAGED